MLTFMNIREMYNETARNLKEMGVRYTSESVQDKKGRFETLEINNYGFTMLGWADMLQVMADKGINMDWAKQEITDRTMMELAPKNPGNAYRHNPEFWSPFLRDGVFSYTYAERLHPQIPHIVRELTERPNTRQAILTMYDQHQDIMNLGGRDRIPCSMHYQFLMRDNFLHCSYVMRSCDFHKFFLADIYMGIMLTEYIAKQIDVETGRFTQFIGSLHAFEGELEGVF